MRKEDLKTIGITAVLLVILGEVAWRIAGLFYHEVKGSRGGFAQDYNRTIASITQWVQYILIAGIWVFHALRMRSAGYRKSIILMLVSLGLYTVLSVMLNLIKLAFNPESLPGGLAVNYDWLLLTGFFGFLSTTMITGLMALPVVWAVDNFKLKKRAPELPVLPLDTTRGEAPAPPDAMDSIHPFISGAVSGGLCGLAIAVSLELLPLLPRMLVEMMMWSLPPVTALYSEFVDMVSNPYIPWGFHNWEKLYQHVMTFSVLIGLGVVIGTALSTLQARRGKRYSGVTVVKVGIYASGVFGLTKGFALHLVGDLESAMRIVGIALGWITAGVLIGIGIILLRKTPILRKKESLRSPLSWSHKALVILAALIVIIMFVGEGTIVWDRYSHVVSSRKETQDRLVRDSPSDVQVLDLAGRMQDNGDLLITGSVSNASDVQKSWMLVATVYDADGKALKYYQMLNGQQLLMANDYEILERKRNLPRAAYFPQGRMLVPGSTANFEMRILDPPSAAVSFMVDLRPTDYNELAVDDLTRTKVKMEKYLATHGSMTVTTRVPGPTRQSGGRDLIDQLGVNVQIGFHYLSPLHRKTRDDIAAIRRTMIKEHSELNLFSDNYMPDPNIFGQIDEQKDWVQDTQFFVNNPYLFVVESAGEYVAGLPPHAQASSVVYSRGKITVRYDHESAKKWFYYINDYYIDSKGIVRLWFINAMDAGYRYVYVDQARSLNLEPVDNSLADHVMKTVYEPREFIHVGRSGKNNISPNDARAKVKLRERGARTVLFVKLWKSRPATPAAAEDFSYSIEVTP